MAFVQEARGEHADETARTEARTRRKAPLPLPKPRPSEARVPCGVAYALRRFMVKTPLLLLVVIIIILN